MNTSVGRFQMLKEYPQELKMPNVLDLDITGAYDSRPEPKKTTKSVGPPPESLNIVE